MSMCWRLIQNLVGEHVSNTQLAKKNPLTECTGYTDWRDQE